MALKGGPSKKIREKGGHVKYYLYWRGVMQLPNDTSKNSTSHPYLVKNERSLIYIFKEGVFYFERQEFFLIFAGLVAILFIISVVVIVIVITVTIIITVTTSLLSYVGLYLFNPIFVFINYFC